MKIALAITLALALGALAAPAAHAVPYVTAGNGAVNVTGDANANHLTVWETSSLVVIEGRGVTAGAGCSQRSRYVNGQQMRVGAACGASFDTWIYIKAGEGDDSVTRSSASRRYLDVRFGPGNDRFEGGDGAGKSMAHGEGGHDALTGGAGSDDLFGDDGNDVVIGRGGNDTLLGGGGNDAIDAVDGIGEHLIACGDGTDQARFDAKGDSSTGPDCEQITYVAF